MKLRIGDKVQVSGVVTGLGGHCGQFPLIDISRGGVASAVYLADVVSVERREHQVGDVVRLSSRNRQEGVSTDADWWIVAIKLKFAWLQRGDVNAVIPVDELIST